MSVNEHREDDIDVKSCLLLLRDADEEVVCCSGVLYEDWSIGFDI